ncbi:MAG TPA: DUF4097 family beta strand repeat-containing protein [Acidimicrobiales bacterium]|nr:DUF4097 family beta strand repeat-containing protein [Acidimicrobiales bacterium]
MAAVPMELTPGRRWALRIGVPIAIALIAYGGLQFVSLAGQDSFRVQAVVAPEGGKVSVSVGNGNLNVMPSNDGHVHVDGVVNYSIVRPSVHWVTTPTGTVFDGPNCVWMGNCGANLDLAVPPGLAVNASSGSGNVAAQDVTGALDLYSGSGNVSLERASGALVLGTGSGDITGTGLSGATVRANDGSGNIELSFNRPPADVKVNASSGDVRVAVPADVSYHVVASSSSGSSSVGVPTDSSSPRVIRATSGSGNVYVVPS